MLSLFCFCALALGLSVLVFGFVGFVVVFETISLNSPSRPGTCDSSAQSPEHWDYRCIPPCLTSKLVLGIEILLTTLRVRGLHVTKQDKKTLYG